VLLRIGVMQKTLMCVYVKFVFCPKSGHISLEKFYIPTLAENLSAYVRDVLLA
jgi:hypothetical protein